MEMKTGIIEIIAEYASNNYESQILQSEEYTELVNNIVELQKDTKRLNLPGLRNTTERIEDSIENKECYTKTALSPKR